MTVTTPSGVGDAAPDPELPLRQAETRLLARYEAALPRPVIRAAVDEARRAHRGARVQNYVGLLVERAARTRLEALSHGPRRG
ncbi:MAG TPA: hypothetical protein VNG13_02405 [Mycobacteriales bacterium]|nr:hypothetical protein [Mycobacteriales bacterium]